MNGITLPGATVDVTPALAKILRHLDRPLIEEIAAVAIGLLDELDGDLDLEDGDADSCDALDDRGTGNALASMDKRQAAPRRLGGRLSLRLATDGGAST
ncbi:MAG: hypothetical protein COC10_08175 [Sphingobium sp.]|nr:MAG: hypothetical protein COC10_08175 [Sphingobium sp.]